MDDLYGKSYFVQYEYGHDPKRARMYELERAQIARRVHPGRILDYGCGLGDFLAGFDDRWVKHGYDVSEYACKRAAEKGIRILDALDGSDWADAVVFRGTLQHIDNPIGALKYAYQALKPGGLLAILATPNTDSLPYKLFGTLPPLDPPRNWIPFGARMLENILINLQYSRIEFRFPYSETPYARPLRDALNFALSLTGHYRPFAWPGNMMECYANK